MKIAMFFRRTGAVRKTGRKVEFVELSRNWTTRDWADLPPHHPRLAD